MDATTPKTRIRFDKFEVDLQSGELRTERLRIRVQPQPMKVLAILLERPGELVTRDELRTRLWPGELYVDFDRGLNRSINKLRRALLDDANAPRYIETISTRGYRFIAPVNIDPQPADAVPHAQPDPLIESVAVLPHWRRRPLLFSTGVLILVSLVFVVAWRSSRSSKASSPHVRMLQPVPLVTFANGTQVLPAFSPDGGRIAYAREDGTGWYLEVKDYGAESHTRLRMHPASFPPGPAWSPDGRQIAYGLAGESDDRGIYVIPATGGPQRKLRSLSLWHVPQRMVSWSPDGRWLAFSDEVVPERGHAPSGRGPNAIYLMSLDSTETRQLTHPGAGDYGDAAPAFSPDGATIAFVRTRSDSHDEIYTVPVQGGVPRRLVTKGLWTNGLAWSSDGNSIVFDRSLAGGFQLWRVSSTGVAPHPLDIPSAGASILEPALWHDRLAYEVHDRVQTVGRISLEPSHAESPATPVSSTRHERAGRYSPDGKHIAFISDRSGGDELWMAGSDGADPVQLTHIATLLFDVAWHPDGKSIAVSTASGKVFVASLDSHSVRLVFNGLPFTDEHVPNIAFSRRGDFLYVLSQPGTGESYDLLKMPIAGGAPVKVLEGRLTNFAESPDGRTLFYSRTDGLWKRPVQGGVEQLVTPAYTLWDVKPDGLYMLTNSSSIERYSFDGRHHETIARTGSFGVSFPLSVSSDSRSALVGYEQRKTSEIDMIHGID